MKLAIQEISTLDGFKDIEKEWNTLLEKSKLNNFFLTFEWLSTWWKYFPMNSKLFILKVMYKDQLIGIAPLIIRQERLRGLAVNTVLFMGTKISDRMDFILTRYKKESLLAVLKYLIKNSSRWDYMDLQQISKGTGNFYVLQECIKELRLPAIFGPEFKVFYASLRGNRKDFMKTLSKNTRKQLRKAENRANKIQSPFTFKRFINKADTAPCTEDLLSEMERIEDISWQGQSRLGIFSETNSRLFHHEIIKSYIKKGLIDISVLAANGKNIAYTYNYYYGNRIYSYNLAYDSQYRRLSPGIVLMTYNLKDSFNYKIDEFDFLRGEEQWKRSLTSNYEIHARTKIFNNRAYSRFLYMSMRTWMGLKERTRAFKRRS